MKYLPKLPVTLKLIQWTKRGRTAKATPKLFKWITDKIKKQIKRYLAGSRNI